MRLHRPRAVLVATMVGSVGVPGAVSAQRAEPVGAQALAAPLAAQSPADALRMPSRMAPRDLAREERTIAGALIGAGLGAVAAYLYTHYRSPAARSGTSDVHDLDFAAYVVAVPMG